MRILVGLGNPGAQYEGTRHNLGFLCLDAVAGQVKVGKWRAFKDGLLAEIQLGKEKHLLFKPMQFMNTSGLPVRQLLEFYKADPANLCILADDVYMAPGTARIRQTGGDGGHNGWRSVLEHVDPDIFWRVRIGAGVYEQHPEKRMQQPPLEDYVLKPLPKHEQKQVDQLIDKVVPLLVEWLEQGTLQEATVHV